MEVALSSGFLADIRRESSIPICTDDSSVVEAVCEKKTD